MTDDDDTGRESAEQHDRISRLSAAILRISASLDVNIVPQSKRDILFVIGETAGKSVKVTMGQ